MSELVEFANNHPLLAVAVLASLFAVIANELRLKSQGLTSVTAAMAVHLINKGATILDVRSADQYAGGHIVNSRHVELAAVEADPASLKKSKDKIVLTVCDNGTAASRAANALRKAGFESVFSLKGGLCAWRADNLPVVK
jgi:rhodanese-related sulfurtransferase